MAQTPTEAQFNAALERVIATAPDGLSEAEFDALVDLELAGQPKPGINLFPTSGRQASDLERFRAMQASGEIPADKPVPARDQLPVLGGMAGAAIGGPPGAAIGGAGGALARDLLRANAGDPQTPRTGVDAFKNVAVNAAAQGALTKGSELASRAAATVLPKLARRLYAGLAKIKKATKDDIGLDRITQTALDARLPITQRGLSRATAKLGESRAGALRMVEDAATGGAPPVQPSEIVRGYRPVVAELAKRRDIGQPNALPVVGDRGRALMRRGAVPLQRAQVLKETAQAAAEGAYRAKRMGASKQLSADDLLDDATAKGFRQAIESRVPGVAQQNEQTQRLLGVRRALQDALSREGNTLGIGGMRDLIALGGAGGGAAIGGPAGAVAGGLLTRLLASPGPGSIAAIGMNAAARPLSQIPYDQLIRAVHLAMTDGEP